jgi:hypothetical protein
MLPTLSLVFMPFLSHFVRQSSHGHHNALLAGGRYGAGGLGACMCGVLVQASRVCDRAGTAGRHACARSPSVTMTRVYVSRRHGVPIRVFNQRLRKSGFSTALARLRSTSSEQRPRPQTNAGEASPGF